MKKFLFILAVLISSISFSQQGAQTTYTVTSIANMKIYSGVSSRVHVTATNEDYVNCPSCTPDEVIIYDGAGTRVWRRVIDPMYFTSGIFTGTGAVGTPISLDADLVTIAGLAATTDNILMSVGSAWASRTPAQVKTALALNNLDNTSDASKPVSSAQQTALNLKANLASPTFSGTAIFSTAQIAALKSTATSTASNFNYFSSDGIQTNLATSQILFGGAANVASRMTERGGFNSTLAVNDALGSHIIGIQEFTEFSSGTHPMVSQLVVNPLTGTNGAAATTNAATVFINGAMSGVTPTGRNDAFRVSGTSFLGSITLGTAGDKINITEGSNGSVGQIALISGTRAITISGLTTASRAFITLVTPSGTTNTVNYQAVCTTNTLTLQANVAAGTINTSDASTLNYFVIN